MANKEPCYLHMITVKRICSVTSSLTISFVPLHLCQNCKYKSLVLFLFDRISPYPSMLHKYAGEAKWEDAIRLCRFVKVKKMCILSLAFFWPIFLTYLEKDMKTGCAVKKKNIVILSKPQHVVLTELLAKCFSYLIGCTLLLFCLLLWYIES